MSISAPTEKGISIGVITPPALETPIQEALKLFPSFTAEMYICSDEADVIPAVKKVKQQMEVLLFSEYRSYKRAMEQGELQTPAHYVPLMGTGLYRALFRLKNRYGLERLSVDSVPENYVRHILKELEPETPTELTPHPSSSRTSVEEIVQFHCQLQQRHPGTIALTGLSAVAASLRQADIPHEWVTPTRQDLVVVLERALLSTQTRRNKESQIVVGLIGTDHFQRVSEGMRSEHELQRMELDLHRIMLDYVKQLDGHLTKLGGGEYLFFTTRGVFERETRGYKYIPLLQDARHHLGISLSIGIGFGRTATDAGNHARLALRQSREFGGNICFIVREDRSVLGPVEISHPIVYELSITDAHILEEAQKAGMSAAYMTKLMAQMTRYDKTDYTAHELASVLGVTVRSAHRILLQWMDASLVEIVGEEKVSSKGRPRQIYRLSFLTRDS
ncbi:transcriptional regulator [Marinithermofilum abyssi]|uniref:Transcriptional regulator n=1 Tax=Marinithermofilum abyssi TaxID=1571185 RepID=A0A8J2VJI0_9BACL|nr:hypothetical protein [Marinithermofilum abyssi]GGE26246.1 transcriptional regulator [Marinithermofilum abyssi]